MEEWLEIGSRGQKGRVYTGGLNSTPREEPLDSLGRHMSREEKG